MKKVIFIFVFTTAALVANAQVKLGVKAGASATGLTIKDFDFNQNELAFLSGGDRFIGFHLGAFAQFNAKLFFVQPEILFTNLNYELTAVPINSENIDINVLFNRIDFPLIVGKKFGPARIFGAPVYSVNLNANDNITKDDLKEGTFGYQVGFGFEFSNLIIDLKYEGAFSETARSVIVNNTSYVADLRTNQFILSFGFVL
jgi:hypothetical protein